MQQPSLEFLSAGFQQEENFENNQTLSFENSNFMTGHQNQGQDFLYLQPGNTNNFDLKLSGANDGKEASQELKIEQTRGGALENVNQGKCWIN